MTFVRRAAVPAALASLGSLVVLPAPSVWAAPPPATLRLHAPTTHVVAQVFPPESGGFTSFSPSLNLEARGGRFEVRVRRAAYGQPIRAEALVGGHWRTVPPALVKGWDGFADGLRLTWTDSAGRTLADGSGALCPRAGTPSRLGPDAPPDTPFGLPCGTHPFTKGQVWGVEQGWASSVIGDPLGQLKLAPGRHYRLKVQLRAELADFLGISATDRTVTFDVDAQAVTMPHLAPRGVQGRPPDDAPAASLRAGERVPAAPGAATEAAAVPADVLPDLVALPALGISTHVEGGRDLLDFGATVYNAGPGPLKVEGFRRPASTVMDAHQFFFRDGKPIGHVPAGTMEYDDRPSHQHWHFKDFAKYDLIGPGGRTVATSGKEAFCLAPSDGIDLLAKGVSLNPGNGDFRTACGDAGSIWVREVLMTGWGDTYLQARAGQSIDVTGLPPGRYQIRITANPDGRLKETTAANDVSLRTVILGGTSGHVTVQVPPYEGIDTEHPGGWRSAPPGPPHHRGQLPGHA
ncbi:MAG: protein-lysine 6-oxidase [Acidimicrobiales bacterium]|nr:protein-lysine 6-oxidase [Acidimicrobiales bacterium]